MTTSTRSDTVNWRAYQLVSCYLLLSLLWAVIVPGGAWPLSPWHYVSMGIDLVLLASVLLLRPRLFPENGRNYPRVTRANILFGLGLVAGVGLLLIRFTSDAAWWTGHLRSGLPF
ncbi:hypothetical protein SAZ10_03050 [Mesorhizobium sp. BAC0120]|uniref:hypothetical protein n=1 Tax=Mesorhizobium sp. BAC0120 TaxID=3090670 RepID=UPI00298C4F9D|nr:hypothetical protein [Mesorhizobium sp. BAC0120]MDW6020734.1 hypothetical protein [Mesorhizobium sp. BAC0120]